MPARPVSRPPDNDPLEDRKYTTTHWWGSIGGVPKTPNTGVGLKPLSSRFPTRWWGGETLKPHISRLFQKSSACHHPLSESELQLQKSCFRVSGMPRAQSAGGWAVRSSCPIMEASNMAWSGGMARVRNSRVEQSYPVLSASTTTVPFYLRYQLEHDANLQAKAFWFSRPKRCEQKLKGSI